MQATDVTDAAPRKTRARDASPETTQPAPQPKSPREPKPQAKVKTKKDQLVDLLSAKGGATVPDLSKALGWLPHTVRAALTGLRKAGVTVEKLPAREGEPTRYRIMTRRGRAAQ
ncbi:MAG: DUF3489 domain-containing protein [Hyphomonadaceae bacterium]